MIGNVSHTAARSSGTRTSRANAAPAVTPIVRAIRSAMAVSATVLALSAPGAFAGTPCSHAAQAATLLCNADFARADTVGATPVDLTWVADGDVPASVLPAAPEQGGLAWSVDAAHVATAAGIAPAEAFDDPAWIDQANADFSAFDWMSSGADIGAGSTFLTTSNASDISVSGVNPAVGLYLGDDAVSLDNSAGISASADADGASAYATGVRAFASVDDASIVNGGTISADATATGLLAYATGVFNQAVSGDASLVNDGTIAADAEGATWTFAFGVYNIASVYYDSSHVDNHGSISATANSGGIDYQRAWAAGVRVSSGYAFESYYNPQPSGHDDVLLTNSGDIHASASVDRSGSNALAWGAIAQALNADGTAAIENDGTIDAYARASATDGGVYAVFADALGAYATSIDGTSSITNHGDILATTRVTGFGYARSIGAKTGYLSSSDASDGEIHNASHIGAYANTDAGYASAIGASTGELNGVGYALVDNAAGATITASADAAGYGEAKAMGISARSNDGADVNNDGVITAYARTGGIADGNEDSAAARGIFANAMHGGEAHVSNQGDVYATAVAGGADAEAFALATGIHVISYDTANVENAGDVVATAQSLGDAYAYGAISTGYHFGYLTNTVDGSLVASAMSLDGTALAVGAYAAGGDVASLANYGDISAAANSVNGDAQAYAAFVYGTFNGIGVLVNGGQLDASAIAGDGSAADATGAYVIANVASVFNDASSNAFATAGAGGSANARGARAYGMYSSVSNYGELRAIANAGEGGTADATGASSFGYYGANAYNAGDILAAATATHGVASATGSYSLGVIFSAYTTNAGSIQAIANGDQAQAMGVLNGSTYIGNAVTVNDGDITASAVGGLAPYGEAEAIAFGVYNFAQYYDSVVDNRGSVFASATATTPIDPTEGFLQAKAIGAMALNGYGIGDTLVTNSGEIGATAIVSTGYAVAWGAVVQSPGVYAGIAQVDNDGSIWSYAHVDVGMAIASGAYTLNLFDASEIVNHGDIVATADSESGIRDVSLNFSVAYGARSRSYYGAASVANYGHIEANASVYGGIAYSYGVVASGLETSVHNAAGADITAVVEAERFGGAFANGVTAGGMYGVDVTNDGTVTAYAMARGYPGSYGASGATGILATGSFMGDATVVNNGVVNAISLAEDASSMLGGGAGAVGIDAYGNAVAVVNAGDVNAIAQAEFGVVGASGINAHGKYSNDITNAAGASIFAYASAGTLPGDPDPAFAVAWGTQTWGSDVATTYNAGSIVAQAVATPDGSHGGGAAAYGSSVGHYSGITTSALVNLGDIEAIAQADFGYATAYGAFVHGLDAATLANDGSIRGSAIAEAGNAFAVGSHAYAFNASVTYNCDAYGCDWSNPMVTIEGGDASIDNAGDILATASAAGGIGYTYGASTFAAFAAGISNTGHITAVTQADDALATAVFATSFYRDAGVVNDGDILAVADGTTSAAATGVRITATEGNASVANAGTITAAAYGSDAVATAVSLESGGINLLDNTGTIAAIGDGERIAIAAGTGSADLRNAGTVIGAIRTGDGDDSFANGAGAMWHAVGESDFGAGDDHILNLGTLFLDDAAIRLGGYASGNTFDNLGTIFVAGADNVIDMDNPFAVTNDGVISFVDGAADDVLSIVGDFAGEGAINVDVSGLDQAGDRVYVDGSVIEPTLQTINVNLLDLPGAAQFEVPLLQTTGTVDGEFVLGNVNYAPGGFLTMDFRLNQSADTVSLGVDVAGLNATGALASNIAPGVHSLVNAQVGTWRQRMGVVPTAMGEAGLAPWLRAFSDSGDVDPQRSANFGGDGAFGFHQSNHGWELGLETRPSAHLAIGALLGTSEGSQHIDGAGSDRFDGSSFGLYATWFADNGFYLDVSHRWTGVDARLRSAETTYETQASAQSTNVEAGLRAWSLGGFNVVPQLQYTHTRIADIDALSNGQAEFVNDGGTSSRARLGVAFDRTFQRGSFALTPYGALSVVREFDGEYAQSINGGLLGTSSLDGTSAMVELGLGARRGGWSLSGGVNWTDGGALDSVAGGQVVVRYGW